MLADCNDEPSLLYVIIAEAEGMLLGSPVESRNEDVVLAESDASLIERALSDAEADVEIWERLKVLNAEVD